ncbi:MAG: type II toxin-antitoxin system VapC family toxin [Mycobacterium sp.]
MMHVYMDTSALVKLIVVEPESSALQDFLNRLPSDGRFTSALARMELTRAIARRGSIEAVAHARRVLAKLDLVPLNSRLLDAAATMMPPELRSLDAIHLAAALTATDLRAIATYDNRLAEAAATAGLAVASPR